MSDTLDILENTQTPKTLWELQIELNHFLVDFISERFQNPKSQEKKEIFFWEFNKYPLQEKRAYRNFVRDAIIDMTQEISLQENTPENVPLKDILTQMPKMGKYEIYAGILNHSQTIPEGAHVE